MVDPRSEHEDAQRDDLQRETGNEDGLAGVDAGFGRVVAREEGAAGALDDEGGDVEGDENEGDSGRADRREAVIDVADDAAVSLQERVSGDVGARWCCEAERAYHVERGSEDRGRKDDAAHTCQA